MKEHILNPRIESMSMVRRFKFCGQKLRCEDCGEKTVDAEVAMNQQRDGSPVMCEKCIQFAIDDFTGRFQ